MMTTRDLIITTIVIALGVWQFFTVLIRDGGVTPTSVFLMVVVAAVTIWDAWMVRDGKVGSSVSAVFIWAGLKSSTVVFALGFIMGHFYGYFQPVEIKPAPCDCKQTSLLQRSDMASRWAHNPQILGSIPSAATFEFRLTPK